MNIESKFKLRLSHNEMSGFDIQLVRIWQAFVLFIEKSCIKIC